MSHALFGGTGGVQTLAAFSTVTGRVATVLLGRYGLEHSAARTGSGGRNLSGDRCCAVGHRKVAPREVRAHRAVALQVFDPAVTIHQAGILGVGALGEDPEVVTTGERTTRL